MVAQNSPPPGFGRPDFLTDSRGPAEPFARIIGKKKSWGGFRG
jgi:hypothetical protein